MDNNLKSNSKDSKLSGTDLILYCIELGQEETVLSNNELEKIFSTAIQMGCLQLARAACLLILSGISSEDEKEERCEQLGEQLQDLCRESEGILADLWKKESATIQTKVFVN